ncbi:hypothetical protein B296_00015066 [Ensete ventricosum]|uniref:Uncharacterized protein n=1 Tax=Ensete ventricosum TaxID=4639 RepID=A0A426ZLN9_ENSVE|nr:hypothetical protein B296_00015066 [Ensete ventricosum]
MYRVDAVGNSLGVRRELAESIRSLLGWRKRVCQKKTETRRKIIECSHKAYREDWKTRREHAGRSPKEDRKIHRKNAEGCRISGHKGSRRLHRGGDDGVVSMREEG